MEHNKQIITTSAPLEVNRSILKSRLRAFREALPQYQFLFERVPVVAVKLQGNHPNKAACLLEPVSVEKILGYGVPMSFFLWGPGKPTVKLKVTRTGEEFRLPVARLVKGCKENEIAFQLSNNHLDLRRNSLQARKWDVKKKAPFVDVEEITRRFRLEGPYQEPHLKPAGYLIKPSLLEPERPWELNTRSNLHVR